MDISAVRASDSSSSPSSPQSSCNSSYGSNSGRKLIDSSNNSVTSLIPGGVVTTRNVSTVISPKGNNNSLQFVKIQTPELSKKAVEQIKLAKETKICKEQINEDEEEWQNNLLNWKLKRKQQISSTVEPSSPFDNNNSFDSNDACGGRKIKTFAEIIEQRAKSGNRVGFHLQKYLSADDEDENSNKLYTQSPPPLPDKPESPTQSQPMAQGQLQLQSDLQTTPSPPSDPELSPQSMPKIPSKPRMQLQSQVKLPPENSKLQLEARLHPKSPSTSNDSIQKAKSGNHVGFYLQRYLTANEEDEDSNKVHAQSSPQLPERRESPPQPETQVQVQFPPESQSTPKLSLNTQPPIQLPPHTPPKTQLPPRPQPKVLPELPKQLELQIHPKSLLPQAQAPMPQSQPPLPQIPVPQHIQTPLDHAKADPNQRKPTREDGDRPVLSVSGKKRCTSCKEELGRGAAAFVVESLSLAYHTNCFRCSVCHVNLSNGFRGVDVRVHFGLLHCQNCYSKDGLNYSRV